MRKKPLNNKTFCSFRPLLPPHRFLLLLLFISTLYLSLSSLCLFPCFSSVLQDYFPYKSSCLSVGWLVSWLVGQPVCHNFIKWKGSCTSNAPIKALLIHSILWLLGPIIFTLIVHAFFPNVAIWLMNYHVRLRVVRFVGRWVIIS